MRGRRVDEGEDMTKYSYGKWEEDYFGEGSIWKVTVFLWHIFFLWDISWFE
jgi:hypothetical protein